MFLIQLAAVRQEQVIDETHQFLSFLSKLPELQDPESQTCEDFMSELLAQHKEYTNIAVLRADGEMTCNGLGASNINFNYRPYFQKMLEEKDFVVGGYLTGFLTDKPILPFVLPVFESSGELKNAVVAYRDLTWLSDFNSSKAAPPKGVSLLVIDESGIVLNYYSKEENYVGESISDTPLFKVIAEGSKTGTARTIGLDGVKKLYSFAPASNRLDKEVYIVVGVEEPISFGKVFSYLAPNVILLLAVAALGWMAARKGCAFCPHFPDTKS